MNFSDPVAHECIEDILGYPSETTPAANGPVRNSATPAFDLYTYDQRDFIFDARHGFDQAITKKPSFHADASPELSLPFRIVEKLVAQASITANDAVLDVGAGRGRLAVMIHELTGASVRGIEIEPSYVEYARSRCASPHVHCEVGDALVSDLGSPTVITLISPFRGRLLERFLARLQNTVPHAQDDIPVRIISQGLCSLTLNEQTWLQKVSRGDGVFEPAIYQILPHTPPVPLL